MGEFLNDGEKAQFYRQDFIGVAADEYLPDWARERLAELTAEQERFSREITDFPASYIPHSKKYPEELTAFPYSPAVRPTSRYALPKTN